MFSSDRKQLLVIDDNAGLFDSLNDVLGNEYALEFAATGQAALLKFLSNEPDCVLLDYQLPGLDGLEILQCIRSQNPGIPVILMSGYDVRYTAIKHGANDFIAKPFEVDELKRILERVLS
jgi:DNA-binding NtrC family response regulator